MGTIMACAMRPTKIQSSISNRLSIYFDLLRSNEWNRCTGAMRDDY